MPRDGDHTKGRAILSTVVFCLLTGLGVGAFVDSPALGGFVGAVVGIVGGLAVAPSLARLGR